MLIASHWGSSYGTQDTGSHCFAVIIILSTVPDTPDEWEKGRRIVHLHICSPLAVSLSTSYKLIRCVAFHLTQQASRLDFFQSEFFFLATFLFLFFICNLNLSTFLFIRFYRYSAHSSVWPNMYVSLRVCFCCCCCAFFFISIPSFCLLLPLPHSFHKIDAKARIEKQGNAEMAVDLEWDT